ncbi:MAG TPA: TIGR01777 family oxidoreductase [Bryobacteraceae bacterium]|jgi:hypothetical protein|nr:TIGR01777 family oxidoreductase [Bryobacteraceae bacterium]
MNYLVTGGTGFIGRSLIDRLLKDGHTVNFLARSRPKNMDSRAAFFCWRENEEPPLDCIPSLDAIVHLAGARVAQRWTSASKRRIWDSRVQSTHSLVDAIGKLKHKPSVLVAASAIGYYGERGSEIQTEQSEPGSGFLADLCVRWEAEAARAREFGLRVVPVRLAIVMGAGGGALKPLLRVFRAGLGGKLGNGSQWMSWIHLQDVVNLLIFAATQQNIQGALNASSPNPVRNVEFTRIFAQAVHRPAIFPVPVFALRLVMGDVADHIVASTRVIPEEAVRQGFQFSYSTLESCLAAVVNAQGHTSISASMVS